MTTELRVYLDQLYCGCGSPEAADRTLLQILDLFALEGDARLGRTAALDRLMPDRGVLMLVLYGVDRAGLTEHGSGVEFGWLTDHGREVRSALQRESADGFESLNADRCAHGYDIDRIEDCPECGPLNAGAGG